MGMGKSDKPKKTDCPTGFPDKENVSVRADQYVISWIYPKKLLKNSEKSEIGHHFDRFCGAKAVSDIVCKLFIRPV